MKSAMLKKSGRSADFFSDNHKSASIWIWLLLILVLTLLVFSNAFNADFIYNWDDNINITNNPHIRSLDVENLKQLFNPDTPIDEPRLTLFSFALEYHFFELNPLSYHLINILLHLINVVLVFLFAARLLLSNRAALLVALLFAIHPMHLEPVAWITGRKDLLFSMFYLLSLLAYLRHIRSSGPNAWWILALVMAFLSLFSKIQAMSLPLIWLALDVYCRRKVGPGFLTEKFFLIILLLYNHFTIPQFVFAFFFTILAHFSVSILKWRNLNLLLDYFRRKIRRGWRIFFGISILALLIYAIFRINKWDRGYVDMSIWLTTIAESLLLLIALAYLWSPFNKMWNSIKPSLKYFALSLVAVIVLSIFVVFVVPELDFWTDDFKRDFSFLDKVFMAFYSMSYYFLRFFWPFNTSPIQPYPTNSEGLPLMYYLSASVIILGVVFTILLIRRMNKRTRRYTIFGLFFFLANLLMVLHLFSIEGRVIVADRYTYLAYFGLMLVFAPAIIKVIEKSKRNLRNVSIIFLSGIILVFSIYTGLRSRIWNDGYTLFTEVIRHYPDYDLAFVNRGTHLLNAGKNQEAIRDFNTAMSLNDSMDIAYYNRALSYYNLQMFDNAYLDCDSTIRLNAEFFDAWYLRAYLKNKKGDYKGAVADYSVTLTIKPDHKLAWYNRGNSKRNLLDYSGALDDYRQTIILDTNFAMAYSGAGVAEYFLEHYQKAVWYFDQAIIKNPGDGNFYYNRGLANLKLNLSDEACRDFRTSWGLGYSDSKNLIEEHCQ